MTTTTMMMDRRIEQNLLTIRFSKETINNIVMQKCMSSRIEWTAEKKRNMKIKCKIFLHHSNADRTFGAFEQQKFGLYLLLKLILSFFLFVAFHFTRAILFEFPFHFIVALNWKYSLESIYECAQLLFFFFCSFSSMSIVQMCMQKKWKKKLFTRKSIYFFFACNEDPEFMHKSQMELQTSDN